jgi:hypothetical protein
MVVQLSKKKEVELQAALSSRRIQYKVLAALVLTLAVLTTLSFAQNGTRDHTGSPAHQRQSGSLPSAPPHPSATHSSVPPAPHGATPLIGNTTQPHLGSQAQLHSLPASQGAIGRSPLHGASGYPSPGEHARLNHQAASSDHAIPVSQATAGTRIEHQLSSGHRVVETTKATRGSGMLHAVRYGSAVTGVVEHPIKSGYLSRTYVQGGRVLYARVYRQNTFQRFGRAFSYERLVPSVAFGAAYYTWAARPWPTPVSYRWGWEAEPWHAAFGGDFTPYPNYSSLDEWLTDYVIAQSLRNAYESWRAENAPESRPVVGESPPPAGNRPDWESSDPGQRPYWESPDDGSRPYWEESSGKDAGDAGAQPKSSKTRNPVPKSQTGSQSRPPAEDSPPPLPRDVKAELNQQIKQQLIERQTQETTSDTEGLPDSLKPGHILFRVNTPLDVISDPSGRYCSLEANDYIERTGEMDENGMVPVKVKAGGISDCRVGLTTRVSVNDLEAMEGEQQQALTDALLAASKNMGDHGLPQAPATTPMLLAAGQTRPAPDATRTLAQLQ